MNKYVHVNNILAFSARVSEGSTSMAAENLLINDGSDGEAVKAISEGFPQLYVEPALACKNTRSENAP